jgi:hypothetical protein
MLDQRSPDPVTEAPASAPELAATATAPSWSSEVEALLLRAAALCVDNNVDPDAFMHACWTACLDARPGMREQIVDMQLTAQVDNLRARGMVGDA